MKLSIIMPVYNEIATIAEVIQSVLEVPIEGSKELIIVDDHSDDGTQDYLQKLIRRETWQEAHLQGKEEMLKVVFHDRNLGKGGAIETAIAYVTGEIVLIQDADLEYDPRDYATLLQPLLEGKADVVFGNRFHGGPHRVLYFWHYLGNRCLTTLCNIVTNLNLTDMEVGYKVFRSDIIKQLQIHSRRFGFEPEITIKLAKLGCRIYEVPISYHGRTYTEGKKIGWKDGLAAFFHIIRYRFFD